MLLIFSILLSFIFTYLYVNIKGYIKYEKGNRWITGSVAEIKILDNKPIWKIRWTVPEGFNYNNQKGLLYYDFYINKTLKKENIEKYLEKTQKILSKKFYLVIRTKEKSIIDIYKYNGYLQKIYFSIICIFLILIFIKIKYSV